MNLDLQHPNSKILFYFWSRSEYRHSKSEFQFLSSQKKKKKSIIVFDLSPSPLSLSHIYIYYKIYSPLSFFLYSLCYWRAFTPQYYDKFLVFISLIFKSCYTRIQYNLFLFLLIPSCRFFFSFLSSIWFVLS